ncbi:MAG: hypothetical protein QNJ38_21870 [Prochloraceae cyanobacterium]|nr:hypothetical protein [Prochloraceae cyanobacterium]
MIPKNRNRLDFIDKAGNIEASFAKEQLKQQQSLQLPILTQISQKHQKFTVQYEGCTIGSIKPLINAWQAVAYPQFGAFQNQLNSRGNAVYWLIENYLKVKNERISFIKSENCYHYTIEKDYILIKIDVTPEDCIASIIDGNQFDLAYFPDPESAIQYSFDLILNPKEISTYSTFDEF